MTPHPSTESTRSVYDTCDPAYLRQLHEASGMDLLDLARTACLSVEQVRQLESVDGGRFFYSEAIKRQAYKRLLMILGAEPPTVEVAQALHAVDTTTEVLQNSLDQIVAMSQQPPMNRTMSDVLRSGMTQLLAHKSMLVAALLLVVAVVLFVSHTPQTESLPSQFVLAAKQAASTSESAASTQMPALVASMPAVVAPEVSATATASSAGQSSACVHVNEALPEPMPFVAHKEGRYVYLVSSANVEVCVVDGNKQATVLEMKAGENRSVYGASPWQVSAANLQKVQIYFQGGRVSLPDGTTNRVKLVEVPVTR